MCKPLRIHKPYSKTDIVLFIVLILVFMLCVLFYQPGHNWGGDFSLYINQAKSITDGSIQEVIKNNRFSIEYSSIHTFSPTLAPWGWPLLLSPMYYFFGLNIAAFKVFITVFFVLFLYVFYRLLSNNGDKFMALMVILYLGTNFRYIDYNNTVLTEIPFLFFSSLTLLQIQHYKIAAYKIRQSVLLGILLYFTFIVRSEGIMLCAALFAWQLKTYLSNKTQYRSAYWFKWLCLPYLILALSYFLISFLLPSGFLSHVNDSNLVSIDGVAKAWTFYMPRLKNLINTHLNDLSLLVLLTLFIYGLISRFIKELPIAIYLVFVIIIFLFWPFQEYRYLFIFFPFIIYFIAQGLASFRLFKGLFQPVHLVFGLLVLLNLFVLYPKLKQRMYHPHTIEGPGTIDSKNMFSYVKEKTNPSDVMIFFRPRVMTLYAQRKTAMIYGNWNDILNTGDYLILHKRMGTFFQKDPNDEYIYTSAFNAHFSKVYENDTFEIFKIHK